MNTDKNTKMIIQTIKDLAGVLRPYVDKTKGFESHPYILSWWCNLLTIASLLEYQEIPITKKQKVYLLKELLGGMGSFNDFSLFENEVGNKAINANKKLCELRAHLCRLFDQ